MKSDKRISVIFVLPNLLPGGAERVMSYIAQKIDSSKFNTTLVVIGYSKDASYNIKGINLVFLEKPNVSSGAFALFKFLKKTKPDITISAIGHLNTLMAIFSIFFRKTKFIAREVNVLSVLSQFAMERNKKTLFETFSSKRFRYFDKVICQSKDMLEDFKRNFDIEDSKLVVINNPITDNFKVKERREVNKPIRFITVARLDGEKGHGRILEALVKVKFDFHYTIIGKGSLKDEIFSFIDKSNLSEKISYVPYTKEVSKYLSESDLYLQGSYTEGFPNSIIESCIVGTPILAYDAPGGLNEIIYPDINGKIVTSVEQFTEALNSINSDYNFDCNEVSKSVSERYDSGTIVKKYEGLFIKVYNNA
ncbi:glycosyltransferase [Winogradskyella sp.]|uniref:glycosyltransferase n=1 Tax=Winogradskyella sp. TaxID=1883156 RepID=UPI002612BA57|nr:glycosyltransferase [Winogradskyella sp.]